MLSRSLSSLSVIPRSGPRSSGEAHPQGLLVLWNPRLRGDDCDMGETKSRTRSNSRGTSWLQRATSRHHRPRFCPRVVWFAGALIKRYEAGPRWGPVVLALVSVFSPTPPHPGYGRERSRHSRCGRRRGAGWRCDSCADRARCQLRRCSPRRCSDVAAGAEYDGVSARVNTGWRSRTCSGPTSSRCARKSVYEKPPAAVGNGRWRGAEHGTRTRDLNLGKVEGSNPGALAAHGLTPTRRTAK